MAQESQQKLEKPPEKPEPKGEELVGIVLIGQGAFSNGYGSLMLGNSYSDLGVTGIVKTILLMPSGVARVGVSLTEGGDVAEWFVFQGNFMSLLKKPERKREDFR